MNLNDFEAYKNTHDVGTWANPSKCNDACWKALVSADKCECSCKGKYHGKGVYKKEGVST